MYLLLTSELTKLLSLLHTGFFKSRCVEVRKIKHCLGRYYNGFPKSFFLVFQMLVAQGCSPIIFLKKENFCSGSSRFCTGSSIDAKRSNELVPGGGCWEGDRSNVDPQRARLLSSSIPWGPSGTAAFLEGQTMQCLLNNPIRPVPMQQRQRIHVYFYPRPCSFLFEKGICDRWLSNVQKNQIWEKALPFRNALSSPSIYNVHVCSADKVPYIETT